MNRPPPTPNSQRFCQECRLCQPSAHHTCAWLSGFGNDRDQPDKTSCLVTLKQIKDETWVCVVVLCDNALRAGKDLIMDTANKLNLPIVVYRSEIRDGYGDFLILNQDQKNTYRSLVGLSAGFLDNDKRLEIFRPYKKEDQIEITPLVG